MIKLRSIGYHRALGIALVVLGFAACSPKTGQRGAPEVVQLSVDSTLDQYCDTTLNNLVNYYKVQLDSQMNRVIAFSDTVLEGGKPESLLSNYIADMYLDLGNDYCRKNALPYGVDLSIVNVHGLRTTLPKGPITVGKIFELMPFENRLVIVSLQGDKLKELLNHIASVGGEGVSGMKMGIKEGKAVNVMIGGKPLDDSRLYHVISIDYLISGGDGMKAFANHKEYIDMDMKCREAILDYVETNFKKGKRINSKLDGRMYHEQ